MSPRPSKYKSSGRVLGGAEKCSKKGHRGKIVEGYCTRCRRTVEQREVKL